MVQPEPEPERKNSISEKKSSSPNHNAGLENLSKKLIRKVCIKNEECDYKKASHSEGEDNGPRDVPGGENCKKYLLLVTGKGISLYSSLIF